MLHQYVENIEMRNYAEVRGEKSGTETLACPEILYRIAFVALVLVGLVLVFCEPAEDSAHWLRDLILSKTGAVSAWYGVRRLRRWGGI